MTSTSSTGAWKQDKGCHDAEGGSKVQESARLRGATETSSQRKFLRRLREGSGMAMHVHVALEKNWSAWERGHSTTCALKAFPVATNKLLPYSLLFFSENYRKSEPRMTFS